MSIGAYNYYLNHDDYDCLSLSRSGLSGQQQPSSRVDIVQVGMCSTHAARSTSSEERAIRSRSARSHSGSDSHPARNRRQGGWGEGSQRAAAPRGSPVRACISMYLHLIGVGLLARLSWAGWEAGVRSWLSRGGWANSHLELAAVHPDRVERSELSEDLTESGGNIYIEGETLMKCIDEI